MRNISIIIFLFLLLQTTAARHFYVEDSSLVVVEVESTATAQWNSGSGSLGAQNIDYLYGTSNYYSNPGNQPGYEHYTAVTGLAGYNVGGGQIGFYKRLTPKDVGPYAKSIKKY